MGRSRRVRTLPLLEGVEIERVASGGRSLFRDSGLGVVFVPWVVPGDVVDVQITRRRRGYSEGRAVCFQRYSEDRVEPACELFGVCGGCQWQMLPYEGQLQFKEDEVREQLARIGGCRDYEFDSIIGCEELYGYRNKMEYSFSPYGWIGESEYRARMCEGGEVVRSVALGFHVPGSYSSVVNVERCSLHSDACNRIRNFVRAESVRLGYSFYDTVRGEGWLRSLILRNNLAGEVMVLLVVSEEGDDQALGYLMDSLMGHFPEIVSLQWGVNGKVNDSLDGVEFRVWGSSSGYLFERLGDLEFAIGPTSFFQTNSRQAKVLYDSVVEVLGLNGGEVLYDLYCGTGTIGLYVGGHCSRIVGIESVAEAVRDARGNALRNGIGHATFISGDVLEILTDRLMSSYGFPDAVITDPPRGGMHPRVVHFLNGLRVPKLLYVSCNPSTLARDVGLLSESYELERVRPVDMFPHTKHVESVALLRARK